MSDEGIDLTDAQATCIALRLSADLLADAIQNEDISWDMVPELSEAAWEKVVGAVSLLALDAHKRSEWKAHICGVDLPGLMERVQ